MTDTAGARLRGNNNPFCQDNDITWIDWQQADSDLIDFTAWVLSLRRQLLPFGKHWYSGLSDTLGLHDLSWLDSGGEVLQGEAWRDNSERVLGCLIGQPGRSRAPLQLLVNPDGQDHDFMLPAGVWQAVLDTAHPRGVTRWQGQGEAPLRLGAHSLILLVAAGTALTF